MKVLHITNCDYIGGAAIATMRLHEAMKSSGIQSKVLVLKRKTDIVDVVVPYQNRTNFFYKRYFLPQVNRIVCRKSDIPGDYSAFCIGSSVVDHFAVQEADIIYLHWINGGFLSAKGVEEILKLGKPVFWFMHDMFPITGGCHHSFGCKGYEQECNQCKYILNDKKKFASKQLHSKIELSRYQNLHWIAPSKWLYECALESRAVDKQRVHLIPNVMSDAFYPIGQKNARKKLIHRQKLDLDYETRYILFGADNVKRNPYKGFDLFVNALEELSKKIIDKEKIGILLFGTEYDEEIANSIPFKTVFAGRIQDQDIMNDIYNASDVFVSASIAENFSLTVLESLSCHIPVVAFGVGGMPDMVQDDCGAIVQEINATALAETILSVLKRDQFNFTISNLCGKEIVIEQHRKLWAQR